MEREIRICDYCGEEILEEDYYDYEGADGFYCSEECRKKAEPSRVCEICGEWNGTTNYYLSLDTHICEECFEEEVTICDYCGRYVFWDDTYGGGDGRYCCEECCNEAESTHSSYIYSYGYKPTPIFFEAPEEYQLSLTEEKKYFFGVENELDADYVDRGVEEELGERFSKHVYLKTDGSLSDSGIEIVSHPMTFNYHLNYAKWDEILTIARRGVWASDGCGMHVHVGVAEFTDSIRTKANLVRFFNKFWKEMVSVSGRENYGSIDDWAGRPWLEDENYENADNIIVGNCENEGRYQAVNLTNMDTVEIRIFQGVNYSGELYKNLALVNKIISICDNNEWEEISKLSFKHDIYEPALKDIAKIKNTKAEAA